MANKRPRTGHERLLLSRRLSLTTRILAVNAIALGLLAGSLFYIDNYRNQLMAERFIRARAEAQITAAALEQASKKRRRAMMAWIGTEQRQRLRLYDANGALALDSFELAGPSFAFVDPEVESWYRHAARQLDRSMDFLLGAPQIPNYAEVDDAKASAWPEVVEVLESGQTSVRQRLAPDRTPVITAAASVGEDGEVLLTMRNSTDITKRVRDARRTLAIIIGTALIISVLLSLFLARTIVAPLRTLVRAAIRVRLGRDREVVVPRLPERGDEIGLLARAISDMTAALRQRIDAVEAFAADVAHEIKNPLASLRSALESMDRVEDPQLRQQLHDIASHDVRRLDRLITEIADASRVDAELSRTEFELIDMSALVTALVAGRESRGVNRERILSVAGAPPGETYVVGDPSRLERVLANLLDNAVSFSQAGGAIEVSVRAADSRVAIAISDHGPGIPPEAREKIFERFHSLRPAGEEFASHSGLGLAIARTIAAAHDGTLLATDRDDGQPGACMVLSLPLRGEW